VNLDRYFVVSSVMSILPHEVSGLPAHILLIHLTIVVVPTAAVATVLSAAWPAARRRLGIGTPLIALIALICVPITVSAGQWLFERVHQTPLIIKHQKLGHGLLPWAIALFAVAVLEYAWFYFAGPASEPAGERAGRSGSHAPSPRMKTSPLVTVIATVLALVVAGGAVVQIYRIGDSGARAAWQGSFSKTPLKTNGGG
jgi:hypothetical protein